MSNPYIDHFAGNAFVAMRFGRGRLHLSVIMVTARDLYLLLKFYVDTGVDNVFGYGRYIICLTDNVSGGDTHVGNIES